MVFRKLPVPFGFRNVKTRSSKFIINELPKTFNDEVYPQIPFKIRSKRYNIKNSVLNTPQGQFYGLTFKVSDLFRDERIVLNYNKAAEIRPQAERLIVEAMRNGDRHRLTMELANYWLRDKALIHKLFKVFVPRYLNYPGSFTAIHLLGKNYEVSGLTMTERKEQKPARILHFGEAVLEMRGNSLPQIIRPKFNRTGLLTNILIEGARESWRKESFAGAKAEAIRVEQ